MDRSKWGDPHATYVESEAELTGVHDPGRTFCTHPQHWTAEANGDSTEFEVVEMIAGLVRGTQPEYVLETGSFNGLGTEAIGQALQKNGHGHLVSIEHNEELADMARAKCEGLPVTVVHGNVDDWVPEGTIDFAFIDAGPDRVDQWVKLLPHVAPHSIFVVHDTAPHHVVWGTMEPYIAQGLFTALNVRSPRGVAICQTP